MLIMIFILIAAKKNRVGLSVHFKGRDVIFLWVKCARPTSFTGFPKGFLRLQSFRSFHSAAGFMRGSSRYPVRVGLRVSAKWSTCEVAPESVRRDLIAKTTAFWKMNMRGGEPYSRAAALLRSLLTGQWSLLSHVFFLFRALHSRCSRKKECTFPFIPFVFPNKKKVGVRLVLV